MDMEINRPTFGQNLPLAGFAAMTGWYLISQAIEQIFHLRPSLALCHLVAGSKRRCPAVRGGGIGGIRFTSNLTNLPMLETMMVRG